MCACVQEYAIWDKSVMPRQAFTKIAKDVGCQLYFPYPGEQVVVLRTGVLLHLKAYMQVCVHVWTRGQWSACVYVCVLECFQLVFE